MRQSVPNLQRSVYGRCDKLATVCYDDVLDMDVRVDFPARHELGRRAVKLVDADFVCCKDTLAIIRPCECVRIDCADAVGNSVDELSAASVKDANRQVAPSGRSEAIAAGRESDGADVIRVLQWSKAFLSCQEIPDDCRLVVRPGRERLAIWGDVDRKDPVNVCRLDLDDLLVGCPFPDYGRPRRRSAHDPQPVLGRRNGSNFNAHRHDSSNLSSVGRSPSPNCPKSSTTYDVFSVPSEGD